MQPIVYRQIVVLYIIYACFKVYRDVESVLDVLFLILETSLGLYVGALLGGVMVSQQSSIAEHRLHIDELDDRMEVAEFLHSKLAEKVSVKLLD